MSLHHGTIAVTSEGKDMGCTFVVLLPIMRKKTANEISISRVERAVSTSYSSRMPHAAEQMMRSTIDFTRSSTPQIFPLQNTCDGEICVLIVDDAALNRKMLRRLIEDRVTSVAEAVDGSDAVNYIRNSSESVPDVIFMDYVMPNMDGPTATREIRALGYKGLIIGVTGNALLDHIDSFLQAGANRVVTKPFRIEDLLDIIEANSVSFLRTK